MSDPFGRVRDSVRSALPPMPSPEDAAAGGGGDGMKYLAAVIILGGVVGNMFAGACVRACVDVCDVLFVMYVLYYN